jgi:hypothetical protein
MITQAVLIAFIAIAALTPVDHAMDESFKM